MGRHLIAMGLTPSKEFSEILEQIYEAQLDGTFDNLEDALAYTQNLLEKAK